MTYGIALWNQSGTKFFDTTSQTWNYIGSFIAPANVNGSQTFSALAECSDAIMQRSLVDSVPNNQEGYLHTVTRSGTTISYSGGNVPTMIVVLGR